MNESTNVTLNCSTTSLTSPTPSPLKRRRVSEECILNSLPHSSLSPANTHIVRVLRNDNRNKTICLHVKFKDSMDKDSILILQKTAFPEVVESLCDAHVGLPYSENADSDEGKNDFPPWKAVEVMSNDRYRRCSVLAGLDEVNSINMTVIHPAESQHFAKYSSSKRHIIRETPQLYQEAIVPYLESHPKDLSWVENILNGTAEVERVLFMDEDEDYGFSLVLDYRWNGKEISELHALALARNPKITCLRDLRACHLPMLRKMLAEGKKHLVEKYKEGSSEDTALREDQIVTYFHYPPTFYRLHVHFVHVEGPADGGTQVGKAYLVEDIIANIELKSEYYAERTIPIYLYDNHPFMKAIREADNL